MKTTFSTYTYRQARAKQKQLEATYNVKWDYFSTGRGITFTPVVTRSTPSDSTGTLSDWLFPYLTTAYQGLLDLHDRAGGSLETILIAAKTLVKEGRAVPGVNRLGHFASIRKQTQPERRKHAPSTSTSQHPSV